MSIKQLYLFWVRNGKQFNKTKALEIIFMDTQGERFKIFHLQNAFVVCDTTRTARTL